MDKRLRFLSVLVVIVTLITFSRVVTASEVGQGGGAPHQLGKFGQRVGGGFGNLGPTGDLVPTG